MIKGVLLDLSGVIYIGDHLIPGALKAVDQLHRNNLPIRFITNTTRSIRQSILDNLKRMGLSIEPAEVFTAPLAARDYIESRGLHPYLLIHPALMSDFAEVRDTPFDAVLVGDAGHEFTYANMNTAFRLLLEGAPLLAMGNNRYFKETDGFSLDIGPFVTALEYAAETQATILGKPAKTFFDAAVSALSCKAEETIMVGDDAVADVGGALSAGLQGILVKTGKYRADDENKIQQCGAHTVDDISAAVKWILEHQ